LQIKPLKIPQITTLALRRSIMSQTILAAIGGSTEFSVSEVATL
jgi:hypothetical protein